MAKEPFDYELDALLQDLHQMLDDEVPPAAPEDPALSGLDLEALPEDGPVTAADVEIDYARFYDEPIPDPEPAPEPPPQLQPEKPKYWTQTQRLPKHVAKLAQNQEKAYADWLYEQDQRPAAPQQTHHRSLRHWPEEQEEDAPPPRKKRHILAKLVVILLLLALALLAVVVFVLPSQPQGASALGARKDGVSTILLVGMDAGGMRTDTMMLLTADRSDGEVSLVSLPRDTLINGGYTVPKLNGVYAANNGGSEGIEMLLTRVAEIVGFRPDGYVMIQLDAFVELVDALGGVTFDVPVDMFYEDPSQDLYIDLQAGVQTLSGEEAMQVARFRSGYTDADLGRVQVQRALLSAILEQAVSLRGAAKAPMILDMLMERTTTNLSATNFIWLAETLLLSDLDAIDTVTLPGTPQYIGGVSYYVLDPASVAQTVNAYCNPYVQDITTGQLSIRTG